MRRFGAGAEMIDAQLDHLESLEGRHEAGSDFEIWPDCIKALQFFLRCQTQWRHAGQLGQPTGLDYHGVEIVARSLGRKLEGQLLEDLQVMETAYLDECMKIAAEQARRRDEGGGVQP